MLDFVDETFHQMTFTIEPFVIVPQDFGTLMGCDDCLDTVRKQIVDKILGSIATISNQALKIETVQQGLGLGTVVALTGGQTQAQRIAQSIHRHVDFATKAATNSVPRLAPHFFERLRHRDVPAQSCYQSSHFPCLDPGQNDRACVPKHRPYTSARSVYKHCSNSHTRQAANAIAIRSGSSISPLQQSGGRLARLFQYRHSALVSRNPESSSIDRRLVSRLS